MLNPRNQQTLADMIGAHLDAWQAATGATDDGAGCIVMLEVMRLMKALDFHPKRTIRLVLWGGEEQGLFGSTYYVLEYETRTAHANMDTYDHLSLPDLKQAVIVVASFVYNSAMRAGMVPRKPLPAPTETPFVNQ